MSKKHEQSEKRERLVRLFELIGTAVLGSIAFALSEAEFHKWSILITWLAVCCALVVVADVYKKCGFKYGKAIFFPLSMLATIFFGWLEFHEPEPKQRLHFTFSLGLGSESVPDSMIDLTNDFLRCDKFSDIKLSAFSSDALLCMPRTLGQTNVNLRLFIKNDSSVDADSPEVSIRFDESCKIVALPGWVPQMPNSFETIENPTGVFSTNSLQSWGYRIPAGVILAGNSQEIAPIQILQQPNPAQLVLIVRAKTSPTDAIGFGIWFPTNRSFVINKPFLLVGTNNEHGVVSIPLFPKTLNDLAKQGFISLK